MQLVSSGGSSVELRPLGYEFPDAVASGADDWDANWLVIAVTVSLADERSWHLRHPCLTTWEARALGDWFHGVVAGDVQRVAFDGESEEGLEMFTEPNLAFSLAARSDRRATIRVHLSAEARPPRLAHDTSALDPLVEIECTLAELATAAQEWDRELASFPAKAGTRET